MLAGNPDFSREKKTAGMLAGNPDFPGGKNCCWREIQTFTGKQKAHAGMLAGNPDFSEVKMKPLRACWQEIQTCWRKKTCGHVGRKSRFSWLGIRSRDHSNRSGISNLYQTLDFWGREPIVFGINTKIGNFKPKFIFWEGF